MLLKQICVASAIALLLGGGASAAEPLPKKPYDPTRPIGLDKPWEIGSPGKTKYDPKEKADGTVRAGAARGYGSNSKYANTAAGKKDSGQYAPIEKETVVKYNNMVVESNKRLKSAGKLYGAALKPIFFDEEADLDQVKEAQEYLAARVEKIHKVMKAYNVPKTKGADAMNRAHMAFLDYQKEMVDGPLNKIMELLEDPNLKPEDKKEEIQALLEEMRKEEVRHYLALKKAQDAYGEAHGIQIIRETIVQPGDGKTPNAKGQPVTKKGYYNKAS
jgi:hypothetical protein